MRSVLGCLVLVALAGCDETRTVDPAVPTRTAVDVVHASGVAAPDAGLADAAPADAGADASADASADATADALP